MSPIVESIIWNLRNINIAFIRNNVMMSFCIMGNSEKIQTSHDAKTYHDVISNKDLLWWLDGCISDMP